MAVQLISWAQFLACAAVIAVAGTYLTRRGDEIAALSGLSRSLIGLVLIATATSLPELATGISAVTAADAPDIAVGDVLGSCVFNLALLVIVELLDPENSVFTRVDQQHVLTAGFGVILIGFVGAMPLVAGSELSVTMFHLGAYVPLIVVLYAAAMRASFLYEKRMVAAVPVERSSRPGGLRRAVFGYLAAALVVAAAGTWLPFIGVTIADTMGWRTSFVGTLMVAAATSLPEAVTAIVAVRIGAPSLAIAGLLGSNVFNVLILAIDDAFYTKGALLWSVSPTLSIPAFAAVIMSGVFIVAALYGVRGQRRRGLSWVGISLLVVYVLSSYATFVLES